MGLRKPVNVLAHATSASEIVNLAAITAVAAEQTNGLAAPAATATLAKA
jgi:phosphotransacetylase